jgi:glycosyltransferase 2 family protein
MTPNTLIGFFKKNIKFLLGIFISLAFIGILIHKFDYDKFNELWKGINYNYVIPAILLQITGVIFFSIRWYYLVEKGVPLRHSLSSSFIGYGANMVLPARGGDIFRIFYCRSESSIQSFNLLSKLFLEKAIDFVAMILTGITAFLFLGMKQAKASPSTIFTFSGIVVIGILLVVYLLRFQNELLRNLLKKIMSKLKKEDFFNKHIDLHLKEFGDFLKIKNFIMPLLFTIPMWMSYFFNNIIVREMLFYDLTFFEIAFILFCGAMSLAIPSAPSGIGVFHASIYTAFLIIGKDGNLGLIYATALHLISFVALTSSGLVFYLVWIYRRRNSGKGSLEKDL